MSESPVTIQVAAGDGELDTVRRLIEAGISGTQLFGLGCAALVGLVDLRQAAMQ